MNRYLYQVPLALAAVFVAITWLWRNRLPDPVASHFGISGVADGFSSLEGFLLLHSILILTPSILGLFFSRLKGAAISRLFMWLPLGLSGLFFSLSLGVVFIQLDIDDASGARIDLGWMLALLIPIALLLVLLLGKPRLKLESNRLVARSLGLALVAIDLGDITQVDTQMIKASQFGGWGLRVNARGELALIPSSGLAIRISRKDLPDVFIRTDEAVKIAKELREAIE